MYGLGKLFFYLSHVRRSIIPIRCIKNVFTGTINNEPSYQSIGCQHTLCYQSIKAHELYYLDLQRVNSTKDMSSSVSEESRHLDYNQLVESKNKPNNIVIDVREKDELDQTGVIPGAYHIPLGDIETAFNTPEEEFKKKYNFDKPSTEQSVIFTCRSGKRSLVAMEKAMANGFKNAKHYKGGWLDWEQHLSEAKN